MEGRGKGKGRGKENDDLQSRVEALERRTNDFALKGQIISSQLFGKVGLDRFFGEPEFWENTYDSGQADCSRRCIKDLTAHRQACEALLDPAERQRCYQEAADNAALCHERCAQSFPTPIG